MKLNAKQLRAGVRVKSQVARGEPRQRRESRVKKKEIYIVLDNVLDTYNIGSIFRLADAIACKKIYLCGETEIPPNHRIKKASINTTEWVDWEYCESAVEAIEKVKSFDSSGNNAGVAQVFDSEGRAWRAQTRGDDNPHLDSLRELSNLQVIAVEQSKKSVQYDKFDYKLPVCLIVGNETTGVSKKVLEMADAVVEIPMFGVNISLNVVVSLGIVLYKIVESLS